MRLYPVPGGSMNTRSVWSSQVSALSIGTGDRLGTIGSPNGTRHGPIAPRSSQAEAAPGPPLMANVTARCAGSPPFRVNAVVTISACVAPLGSVSLSVETVASNAIVPPRAATVWLVVLSACANAGSENSRNKTRARFMPSG